PSKSLRAGRSRVLGSNAGGDLTLLDGASFKGDPGGTTDLIGTRHQAETMNIDDAFFAVRTTGFFADGDGGGKLYRRTETEPTNGDKFQSADGSWWEAIPHGLIDFASVGGRRDDPSAKAANTTALLGALMLARAAQTHIWFGQGDWYF